MVTAVIYGKMNVPTYGEIFTVGFFSVVTAKNVNNIGPCCQSFAEIRQLRKCLGVSNFTWVISGTLLKWT